MSKPFPRRRDVRDKMVMMINILCDNLYTDDETGEVDFDREFLTEVRDMMREGLSLGEVFSVLDAAAREHEEAEAIYDAQEPDFGPLA